MLNTNGEKQIVASFIKLRIYKSLLEISGRLFCFYEEIKSVGYAQPQHIVKLFMKCDSNQGRIQSRRAMSLSYGGPPRNGVPCLYLYSSYKYATPKESYL